MSVIKKITVFVFTIVNTLISAQSVAIGASNLFDTTPNSTWTRVITLTTISEGAASQAAQTLVLNITNLPVGAQYRVYKTTANGSDFFGNPQDLLMGNNTITVDAVSFDRAVKIQFDNESVEFDMLTINGQTLYDGNSNGGGGTDEESCIGTSNLFDAGPNSTWTRVITLTTISEGAASQAAQTLVLNITNLPVGAQYRVYKTTANGSDFFGNPQDLLMGINTITVGAVSFDRAVKIQFNDIDVCFSSLSINGQTLYDGNSNGGGGTDEESCIGTSNLFDAGPNSTWTRVITLTTISEGAASQAAQTLVLNITNLPVGAQYRVYKTTANGSDFFGNPQDLLMGINTITVGAVSFDRAVKIQFNDIDVCFSSLSVNGIQLGLEDLGFSNLKIFPNPAKDVIFVEGAQNIISIKVYSILGSLEKEVFNTNQVDISDLYPGIHFLKLDNGSHMISKQIIKK